MVTIDYDRLGKAKFEMLVVVITRLLFDPYYEQFYLFKNNL